MTISPLPTQFPITLSRQTNILFTCPTPNSQNRHWLKMEKSRENHELLRQEFAEVQQQQYMEQTTSYTYLFTCLASISCITCSRLYFPQTDIILDSMKLKWKQVIFNPQGLLKKSLHRLLVEKDLKFHDQFWT